MNLTVEQLGGLIVGAIAALALVGVLVGVWVSRAADYPPPRPLTPDPFDDLIAMDEACALTEPLPEVD